MKINNILKKIISEQLVLKTTKTKPIVNAIKNRNPITFYYSGPKKPKKDSVKNGKRIEAEAVALGLSKKGNLIVRAWVQPPSVSKKGFNEHGWRTFMVSRMNNVEIISDKTFNQNRPKYKLGDDKSMTVTYVTSDWTNEPKKTQPKEKPITKKIEPIKSKKIEPVEPNKDVKPIINPEELPQIKPIEKPSIEPDNVDKLKSVNDVFNTLKTKIKNFENKKSISFNDYNSSLNDLYKRKENEWVDSQKKIGGNTIPGQGTRERFKKESKIELDNQLKNNNIEISNDNLQENILRIKSLML